MQSENSWSYCESFIFFPDWWFNISLSLDVKKVVKIHNMSLTLFLKEKQGDVAKKF